VSILNKIIEDKNLVWDKSLNNKIEKFQIDLSTKTLNELMENRNNLAKSSIDNYPSLKKEITILKNNYLTNGFGFLIINGICFKEFKKDEMIEVFRIISLGFGELIVQNIKKEKLVVITNEGKSMKTGGRYHQTNEGGSFHTDSPQWEKVPDFVGLFCINPAKKGGTSKYVSAYTLHNQILKSDFKILQDLYSNFHFDKRGEFKEGESPTTFKPIFQFMNNKLRFRYLRNYIDAGQKRMNSPLSTEQNFLLDKIDRIIHDDDFSVSYDLRQFDMTFFNNHRTIHGRTGFEDYEETEMRRLMIRSWIRDE
jgi:alpha-ketoglutarate-dependent taurine dioxygenase|tara:strand:+ start:401 stop:1327 length:927 start_codon:yes stop_codon:yes gene_type:complete